MWGCPNCNKALHGGPGIPLHPGPMWCAQSDEAKKEAPETEINCRSMHKHITTEKTLHTGRKTERNSRNMHKHTTTEKTLHTGKTETGAAQPVGPNYSRIREHRRPPTRAPPTREGVSRLPLPRAPAKLSCCQTCSTTAPNAEWKTVDPPDQQRSSQQTRLYKALRPQKLKETLHVELQQVTYQEQD